uniref:Reverse transcriptase domain-containing protein n=1 Tax=Tanacetum cinerariifolium TaxID=118510 RepID=A0A6L2KB88_TANCI|nr:reverse transcriptase domain-containing protein [Tanacetum cinerariifolium]
MPNVDIPQGIDTGGSPRCQETMGGTFEQTRSERVLEQPNEPPLTEGHTSGSGEGRLKENIELTDTVPTPYDSPLTGGKRNHARDRATKEVKEEKMIQLSLDEELAQKLYAKELAKKGARQKQERYNLEKVLELQRQLEQRKENVPKGDQAKEIDWNDPQVLRYHALQNRPFLKAEVRKNMFMIWDQFHTFVPKDSEIEREVMKRAGLDLHQGSSKKQRIFNYANSTVIVNKDLGTDNRPPMLVESDYESWKIRIERYIHVTEGQGAAAVQVTRDKTNEEFTEIENNRELADIQATNILSQRLPRHAKYVTNVKNNKDIFATTYVELYTYLKSYEPYAIKTLNKQEQSSSIVDPLAYLASTTHHLMPTQPLIHCQLHLHSLYPHNQLLNQLRTSSNSRSHATVHDGQIVTETVQRKAPGNVGNIGTRGTQSYGHVTDNKGKLVICYNCRGEGHVSRQCKEKKRVKDSQYFKDKMLLMKAKEKGAVLDAKAEAFLADVECTAPYDQPLVITTTNIFEVNQEQSVVNDPLRGELARSKLKIQTLERNKVKHDLDTTIVQRNKRNAELKQENVLLKSNLSQKVESINSLKTESKKVLSEKKDLEERYLKEIVCLKNANKVATEILQKFQQPTQTIPMLTKRPKLATHDLHKIALGSSNPWYAKQAKIAQPTLYDGHALLKPTNTPVRVHDSEESLVQANVSRTKMSNRPRTIKPINYDELNALYSHFVPQKELSREQVYWLPLEELATQKSNSPKLQITALTAENSKLKSESLSKMHSEPIVPEKPKVLAPGMYAISSKYTVPPRRVNRAEPTPLPKKKQATFQEPPRPSNRPTQKIVVEQNKKPNIHVNLSTGVKPATGASKPMSKSDTQNHSTLSAKREKARRVEDHHRNLNKQNHVDSCLNVKRTGFVSNLNTVYNACNESLVFANHDNCVIRNLKSVNVKTPTAKYNVKTTKKVWKAKVVTVRSLWKPTGRCFTLYDEYPLTRIVEPIVEPLELTPCVSSNSKVTMISRVMSSPNHPTTDIEDAFSSNFLDYTTASPNYFPASPRNISPHPPDNLPKYLLASLAISPFHAMQAYNAVTNKPPILSQDPITPPTILTPSLIPPKMTSTSEASAMTHAAIRKLVADSVAIALESQATTMASTNNPNRNSGPRKTPIARNNCAKKNKVKFAINTLTEEALFWWNSFAQPLGVKEAYKINWSEFKRLLIKKYCPQTEIKKMEEAITMTQKLIEQVLKHNSVQETNNHKRKLKDRRNTTNSNNNNYRNNNPSNDHHQQQNKRKETFRTYTANKSHKSTKDKAPKPTSSQPSKPKPAPSKPSKAVQEKKRKLVKETPDEPSPAKRSKGGLVGKRCKPKIPLKLVDELADEGVVVKEPAYNEKEANL